MEKIIRFSVSLTQNLLDKLDEKIRTQGYASRSEFTRDLIRDKIVKDQWQESKEELIGVFSVVYDHHQNELVMKKMRIEHDAKIEIVCTTHIHVDHHNCLETSILRGKADFIKDFVNQISGLKGVKFTDLSKIGIPET